jgi:hypothetical protein
MLNSLELNPYEPHFPQAVNDDNPGKSAEFCEWFPVIHESNSKFKKQALWTDKDKTESKSTQTGMINTQNMQQKKDANVLNITVWEGIQADMTGSFFYESLHNCKVTRNFAKHSDVGY